MRIDPELSGISVVMLGNFNPPIFNPDWLARKEIIGPEVASDAKIEVIHREMSAFRVGSTAVRVLPDRFTAEINVPPLISVRDFVLNIFNSLPETPINRMGINFSVHFPVDGFEKRDAVGVALAPPDQWGEWAQDIAGKTAYDDPDFKKKHGGMRSLSMMQRDLDDRENGHIVAKVEPSLKIGCGIFVEVNDHYETDSADPEATDRMLRHLEQNWEKSVIRSEWICDQVMRLAE